MYKILNFFLNILFPEYCIHCNICLNYSEPIICSKCVDVDYNTVSENAYENFYFRNHFYLTVINETFKILIHNLKYQKRSLIGTYFGKKEGLILQSNIHFKSTHYDYITPVPLHRLKKHERGYNQAEKISKGLSDILGIRKEKIIKKVRNTESQTKLSKIERVNNVKKSFKLNKKLQLKNKNILIVDDVFTTGSTVNECAKILRNSGANIVDVITICHA